MAGSTTKSWWDYSKWMANVGRNCRITPLMGNEILAARGVLKLFWDPVAQTGTRPWLNDKFLRCSVNSNYQCNIDTEPVWVLSKLIDVVGRDLKKIPMTDGESLLASILIVSTNNRHYGTAPYYGGVIGAHVTVP